MWTDCQQVLDQSVTKWGFEFEDLMLLGGLSIGALIVVPPLPWLAGTVGGFVAIYRGKRGKPPGAILHWLHEHELVLCYAEFSLPGCIPARTITYAAY